MAERRTRPRSMAHPSRRAGIAGLGLLASLLLVTGVVRATGLPWPTASPGRSSIPVAATPAAAAAVAATTPATAAAPAAAAVATSAPTPAPELATTTAPVAETALVWNPSGTGQVTVVNMPAPWIGGSKRTADVSIYTPPGYDPAGTQQ